jgi:hypothetical protein
MAKIKEKADAVVALASGQSSTQAARSVGVALSTVKHWQQDPVFQAEVERLRSAAAARPVDPAALLEAVEESRRRILGVPPVTVHGDGRLTVHLSIPAYATARERRRLMARGLARGIVAALEGE